MADKLAGVLLRGLIAGVIGAWTMDRATWLLQDREPRKALGRERRAWRDGLDVSHALGHTLTSTAGIGGDRHQPSALGMTTHYLLSIVPATLYAAMRERDLRYSEDFGLLYGFLIFLLWDEGVAPAAGISGGPSEYPWQAHGRGLVGHLALGIATHAALTALERDFDRRPIGSHAGA